jgi:hypothetical protein
VLLEQLLVVVAVVAVVGSLVLVFPIKEPLEQLELPMVRTDKAKAAGMELVVVVVAVAN